MKAKTLIFSLAAGSLLFSCTGDPTRGGIFWSESKAMDRQADLRNQQELANSEFAAAAKEQSRLKSLKNQLAQKRRQLSALTSAPASASGSANAAECARLRREISQLEKDIRTLSDI